MGGTERRNLRKNVNLLNFTSELKINITQIYINIRDFL